LESVLDSKYEGTEVEVGRRYGRGEELLVEILTSSERLMARVAAQWAEAQFVLTK